MLSEQKYHLTTKHLTFNEHTIEHLINKHVNIQSNTHFTFNRAHI